MIIPISAISILLFFAIMEYFVGERRKCWSSYIVWFFVILGSMYFAKVYGYQKDFEDQFCRYAKFVPNGTPDHYINEDNTLSESCLRLVRATDKETAWQSFKIHRDKGKEYFKKAEQSCWYMPTLKDREKAKMAFTTAISAVPGPWGVRLVTATLTFLGQYGICCIDEYFDIEYSLNMASYHFRLADAFHNHLESKGWL